MVQSKEQNSQAAETPSNKRLRLGTKNYYSKQANEDYFSVSQVKDMIKCEAMALAKVDGAYKQPMTKALLVGSFVDAYFEGTLARFKQENPDVFTMKNALRSEFKKANEIIQRVSNDKYFAQFMSGKKQKIITFELFGAWWKCKLDSYVEDKCITDLKIVQNFKSMPFWRYDIQGAIYQKGIEIKHKKKLPFYLAVATKERVIDFDIFNIDDYLLVQALEEIEVLMPRFIKVKAREVEPEACGVCDYCKANKQIKNIRYYSELLNQ